MDRLASFIRLHGREVARECESIAAAIGNERSHPAGTHARELLAKMADRLEERAFGEDALVDLATNHAAVRYRQGFPLSTLVREYGTLRRIFLSKYATEEVPQLRDRLEGIGVWNDCIDGAISGAVEQFAREAVRSRELFVAAVNHDLGNEVGVIRMTSRSLLDEKELPTSARDKAAIICDSAKVMARVVSDLADFTLVQWGGQISIQRQPCDVCAICRRVVESMQALSPDRTLTVDCAGASAGNWDADRLAQVARNLIANALDHGQGPVKVRIGRAADGAAVEVSVWNKMPVISARVMRTLFEPFQRGGVHRSDGNHRNGVGLGLYMVKRIVAAHGGQVDVKSTVDGGTTFTFRLPLEGNASSALDR
jgi:signal transduction histidine kinase